MSSYAIGSLVVHNTDWQKEYSEKMPVLIRQHGGTLRARASVQLLEGTAHLPGTTVIIEFPSAAQARAWYDDPAHVPLKQLRNSGASFDLVLLDGV
ncbi:DUF1330 domain-containing protein [Rhodoferax ferrireducens]|uniref:DUF1330 domain-containing protein n=1 Tax=Rhodoferax ferrireducens TaxID=192843 RepID=UPI000E0DD844|nr:DUF1330 domain-containing protein [Rhodoferax ferrireducens]